MKQVSKQVFANQKRVASTYILDELRDAILSGKFKKGEILMPEREMATLHNVGHSTIRKVTQRLVDEKLLIKIQGKGVVITGSVIEQPLKATRIGFLLNAVNWQENQSFAISDTISKILVDKGIELVFASSDGGDIPATLLNVNLNGIILFGHRLRSQVLKLNAKGINAIAIGVHSFGPAVKAVISDEYTTGFMGAEHLIENGHKSIVFLGGNANSPSHALRQMGCMDAMKYHGLSDRYVDAATGATSSFDAKALISLIDAHQITGIVTSSTTYSDQVQTLLDELPISIPNDLSLVSLGCAAVNMQTTDKDIYDSVGSRYEDLCDLAVIQLQALMQGDWSKNQLSVSAPSVVRKMGSVKSI